MGTHDQPEPDTNPIFHGVCPLVIAALGAFVAHTHSNVDRFRDAAEDLIFQGGWAVYMTLTLGLAIASLRRGPKGGRWAAAVAIVECVVSIGWVAVACAKVLWR
jgi:hypothetical protein